MTGPATPHRVVTVRIEFTPLGRALIRLAGTIAATGDQLPDEIIQAALDVIALSEEHRR